MCLSQSSHVSTSQNPGIQKQTRRCLDRGWTGPNGLQRFSSSLIRSCHFQSCLSRATIGLTSFRQEPVVDPFVTFERVSVSGLSNSRTFQIYRQAFFWRETIANCRVNAKTHAVPQVRLVEEKLPPPPMGSYSRSQNEFRKVATGWYFSWRTNFVGVPCELWANRHGLSGTATGMVSLKPSNPTHLVLPFIVSAPFHNATV